MNKILKSILICLCACIYIQSSFAQELPEIFVDYDNKSFKDENDNTFFPWGFNYVGNEEFFRLIEDEWHLESTWLIIEEDFQEMKDYCANSVRIHLNCHQFMNDQNTVNQDALDNLERLIGVAEDVGLYLDITGLSAYRKSDQPEWYDEQDDLSRWITHRNFWQAIASVGKNSNNVLNYNLMNEPAASVCNSPCPEAACEWLIGEGLGSPDPLHFVQNITRTEGRDKNGTMSNWIDMLSCAIKEVDPETPVTLGTLSIIAVDRYADNLDFLSPHYYPRSGQIEEGIQHILANESNKPLVIEETYNLHCSIDELAVFLDGIDGNYQGLYGHYFGKTIEEYENEPNSFVTIFHIQFLKFFLENNPNTQNCECPNAILTSYYIDEDRDGYGLEASLIESCKRPIGYIKVSGDCDDTNPAVNPSAIERCDGIDNNCSGEVDDEYACFADCSPWISIMMESSSQDGEVVVNWTENNGVDVYPFVVINYLTNEVHSVVWSTEENVMITNLELNTFYVCGALDACAGEIVARSAPLVIFVFTTPEEVDPCDNARVAVQQTPEKNRFSTTNSKINPTSVQRLFNQNMENNQFKLTLSEKLEELNKSK